MKPRFWTVIIHTLFISWGSRHQGILHVDVGFPAHGDRTLYHEFRSPRELHGFRAHRVKCGKRRQEASPAGQRIRSLRGFENGPCPHQDGVKDEQGVMLCSNDVTAIYGIPIALADETAGTASAPSSPDFIPELG